jgi:hypothetical protein
MTAMGCTAAGAEEQKDEGDEAEELVSMRQMAAGGNVNARKLELVQQGETAVGPLLAPGGLAEFSRMLSVFTHCSKLKVCTCRDLCCCRIRALLPIHL